MDNLGLNNENTAQHTANCKQEAHNAGFLLTAIPQPRCNTVDSQMNRTLYLFVVVSGAVALR